MFKQILVILMLAWCTAAAAAGGVYKWVDEEGNVQYRDIPPPPGSQYETIQQAPPPGEDPAAGVEQPPEPVEAVAKPPAASGEEAQEQPEDEVQALEKRRAEVCQRAQRNLAILEKSEHPIRIDDEGNRILLSTEERDKELELNRKHVEYYCSPSDETAKTSR